MTRGCRKFSGLGVSRQVVRFRSDRGSTGVWVHKRKPANEVVSCQRQRLCELNEQMEDLYLAQILQRTFMM
jgi:hypothetical protein